MNKTKLDQPVEATMNNEIFEFESIFSPILRRWSLVLAASLLGIGASMPLVFRDYSSINYTINIDPELGPKFCTKNLRLPQNCSHISRDSAWSAINAYALRLQKDSKFKDTDFKISPAFLSSKVKSSTILSLIIEVDADNSLLGKEMAERITSKFAAWPVASSGKSKETDAGYFLKGQPSWISPITSYSVKSSTISSLMPALLGFTSGIVIGCILAVFLEQITNRVFSKYEIQRTLGFPIRAYLPALPWQSGIVNSAIKNIQLTLDPSLEWRVTSIGKCHKAVNIISEVCRIDVAMPLLTNDIKPPSIDSSLGLLIVVEPGFNSLLALQYASLLLNQVVCVKDIGLVMLGCKSPEE